MFIEHIGPISMSPWPLLCARQSVNQPVGRMVVTRSAAFPRTDVRDPWMLALQTPTEDVRKRSGGRGGRVRISGPRQTSERWSEMCDEWC